MLEVLQTCTHAAVLAPSPRGAEAEAAVVRAVTVDSYLRLAVDPAASFAVASQVRDVCTVVFPGGCGIWVCGEME